MKKIIEFFGICVAFFVFFVVGHLSFLSYIYGNEDRRWELYKE